MAKKAVEPVREERSILYEITRGLAWVVFHTLMPVTCHNRERLDAEAPYVVIANHQHALDPIVMAMYIRKRQIVFLGKKELGKNKLVANLLTRAHCILVDRHATDMSAMRNCMKAVKMKKILLIFSGVVILSSLLVTVVNYILGEQISQTGGLGSIGTRSLLATVQTVLPIVQGLAAITAEFGYMAAMLRIARGQYTSPMTMKMGMDRFWVLLRSLLLQVLLYTGACFGGSYLASLIYSFTPLSHSAMALLAPMLENATDPQAIVAAMDEATQLQFLEASLPLFLLVLLCSFLPGAV